MTMQISHVINDNALKNAYWNIINFPHHAFHLPGAAGTIPHQPRIIYFFVCHLGLVTVLVVQIMALLALNQLVPHGHCHLSLAIKNTTAKSTREWKCMLCWYPSLRFYAQR